MAGDSTQQVASLLYQCVQVLSLIVCINLGHVQQILMVQLTLILTEMKQRGAPPCGGKGQLKMSFSITGRDTVATGSAARDSIKVGTL